MAVVLHAASTVAPGVNQFATTAYHELARGDQNLIFSPFNIATALSMLLEGARGDTAARSLRLSTRHSTIRSIRRPYWGSSMN
jgi:serine protease inhibitor